MKKLQVLLAAVIISVLTTGVVFAATFSNCWVQDSAGNWKVRYPDGTYVTNAWFCDDAVPENGKEVWYLLDATGNMISAGLVQDGTGNFYSLETDHNGYYGMLRYKSGVYDGISLQLESSHNGAFAAIKNQDGIDKLREKYGLMKVNISNSNCVYSSSLGAATVQNTTVQQGSASERQAEIARRIADEFNTANTDPELRFEAEGNVVYTVIETYEEGDDKIVSLAAALTFETGSAKERYIGFSKAFTARYGEPICFGIKQYNCGKLIYKHVYK